MRKGRSKLSQRRKRDFLEKQRQFFEGERDFEDAMTIEDIICKVTQLPDGSVVDAWGRVFGL